jgi:E3 ubiquitin-protein ligase HECTD1
MPLSYINFHILSFDYSCNRAIVWLQGKRDQHLERHRGPVPRRDDGGEYRVGRLKHERVKIPRGERLLEWAIEVRILSYTPI